MLDLVFVGVVALFVGWNFPQPEFAKRFQNWLVSLFRGNTSN